MKALIFLFIAIFCLAANALDKDWVLDPKTSTLIPKYMALVKVVNGKVMVEDRELKKGSKIYANDLIQTADKSYVVLDLIDLTTITIGPNSEFKADSWSYRTKNDRDAIFSVLKGQWRALVRSKSKTDNQLKIKTPTASMGIRGTELLVNVLKQGDKDVTQVALMEGAIHIDGDDTLKGQDLKPGDHAILVKNPKGITRQDTTLKEEELNSLKGFVAPDVPRLLPPVVLKDENVETTQALSPKQEEKLSGDKSGKMERYETITPWKENLKKLNAIREKNLKK